MDWIIARAGDSCGRCSAPIGAGEAYAKVSEARRTRCAACVAEVFGLEPPEAVYRPVASYPALPSTIHQGFTSPRAFSERAKTAVRDGKLAQVSEHDR